MRDADWETDVVPYVVERLKAETQKHGQKAAIARATKVSDAHVSNVTNDKSTPGEHFIRALCKHHWHISVADLHAHALAWSAGREPDTVVQWRHPNLAAAVDLHDEWPRHVLAIARQLDRVWPPERDRSRPHWYAMLCELEEAGPDAPVYEIIDESGTRVKLLPEG